MFRRIAANWALICAVLLAGAFVGEWAIRFMAPQSMVHALTIHDGQLGRRGAPNAQAVFTSAEGRPHKIRLNGAGLRVNEEVSRSPERRRVVVYGGSSAFAAHLPYAETYFARLKEAGEAADRRIQMLNGAVNGHGIAQTRLLMSTQIPAFKPAALVYFFDGEDFWRSIVADPRRPEGQLHYGSDGRPRLNDGVRNIELEYLETLRRGSDWLHRHSHLTTLAVRLARRATIWVRRTAFGVPAEVRLLELPRFASESADIQERQFVSELNLQRMMRMANAADVPLMIVWVPARLELGPGSMQSSAAAILGRQRRTVARLASGFRRIVFLDTVAAVDQFAARPDPNHLYATMDSGPATALNAEGAAWLSRTVGPAVIGFLNDVSAGRL